MQRKQTNDRIGMQGKEKNSKKIWKRARNRGVRGRKIENGNTCVKM